MRRTICRLSVLAVAAGMMLITLPVPARAGGRGIDYLGVTGNNCILSQVSFRAADDAGRSRALLLYVYKDGTTPTAWGADEGRGLLSVEGTLTVTPGDVWWLRAELYPYNARTGEWDLDKPIATATYSFTLTCPD